MVIHDVNKIRDINGKRKLKYKKLKEDKLVQYVAYN